MIAFGFMGYVLRKLKFDPAPLLLAVVLGDRMEISLRRALIISDGDYWGLLRGGASKVFVTAVIFLIVLQGIAWALGYRKRMADDV